MIRETRKVQGAADVSNEYVYDAENRLRQAVIRIDQGTEKHVGYTCDADGIRTSKTVTTGTDPATASYTATHYVVDKNRDYAQVLAEWQVGVATRTRLVLAALEMRR